MEKAIKLIQEEIISLYDELRRHGGKIKDSRTHAIANTIDRLEMVLDKLKEELNDHC